MPPDHLHILQHALGLDRHGQPSDTYTPSRDDDFPGCYRNRYVTHPDATGYADCEALRQSGHMTRYDVSHLCGAGSWCYAVTQLGYDAVKTHSPPPPRLTRGQERYRRYRRFADCFTSFLHFLRYEQHHGPCH